MRELKYYKLYWLKNKDKINRKHRENYRKTNGKWHKKHYQKYKSKILKKKQEYYHKIIRKRKGIKNYLIKWEKWEDNILLKYYGVILNSKIKRKYFKNRTLHSIRNRATKKLNLRTHIKFSNKEKKMIGLRNTEKLGKTFEELYGEIKSKKIKERMSKNKIGKNNPSYKDGSSKLPYPLEWNNNLKEQIKQRDKKCMICNLNRNKCKKINNCDLIVHHIDRNKNNLNPLNLISLCIIHHSKIQNFQNDLQDYFLVKNLKLY